MTAVAMLLALMPAADLHAPLDALLQRHVDGAGRVAYRDLAAQDLPALDAYLAALAAADPEQLPQAEQIAFWINAYNAHVIRAVVDGHDAEGFLARKRFFAFRSFPLAGQSRSLDDVEHRILRQRYREPRIHFALVCASTSCPVLRREAYRGERLDAQLDEQTRTFLADPRRNQLAGPDVVRLSSIFKWFGDDFRQTAGSVPDFVRRYQPVPAGARVEYLDYDWTLNAQPGQRPQ